MLVPVAQDCKKIRDISYRHPEYKKIVFLCVHLML